MGRAVVDLPDPMQPPVSASATSTDDLLAQLAGEEIDRLLAGGDAGPPAELHFPPVAPIDFSNPPTDGVEIPSIDLNAPVKAHESGSELDALLGQLATEPAAKATVATPSAQAAVVKENKATAEPSSAVQTATAPAVSTPSLSAAPSRIVEAPAQPPVDQKLVQELEESESRAKIVDYGTGHADVQQEAPLPAVLRPLEWINAPFAAMPPNVRDALGKVAILTLFNSLAVLIYLLLFRRHV